ncbi:FxSxx-COOH system tetratricopeptide repeat protein [Glycomyces scopariae]
MVEPLTATALGGLAIDKAQAEITKWVGAQIKVRVELALRNKVLEQGLPAKDQQAELSAVLTRAVVLTARELFPGQQRLQKKFSKTLLKGKPEQRPLVNGSDLAYITDDVHEWISKHDPQSGTRPAGGDPEAHPYLAILCRNIIAQYGFRAENNGAKNTILHPRWNRFWTTELFNGLQQPAAPAQTLPQFRAEISGPVGTVIQAQQVTIGSESKPVPAWPRRFGTFPQPATARLERPVDQELTDALEDGGTAVVCQILSGMGGIGKTQIAAHYAHQQWKSREVDLLVWINAATRESITTAYSQAGSEFCNADPSDSGRAARTFLNWLDSPSAPRWLIVLDDLNDPKDLSGMWPPSSTNGRTIVTTRRRDTALDTSTRKRIKVDLYTSEQALQYLTDRLQRPELLTEATELAADLDHLPLAIAQAAVYILDQPGTTCATYRALLADRALTLDHLSTDTLPEDYPHTVAAALQLSIDHADQYEPAGFASDLLAVASLLDSAGIPADLFTAFQLAPAPAPAPGKHTKTPSTGDESSRPAVHSRTVTDTLARLHRLSIIDYDGTTVRIHALLQRTRRDQLDRPKLDATAHHAASALVEIWPEVENDPVRSASLRANVTRLREHAQAALLQDDAHPVLFHQGNSLGDNGLVNDARLHFEELHQLCEDALGSNHLDTLATRGNLATWQGEAGDAAGAAAAFAELLTDSLRVLGPDHPDALTTRGNLAGWRGRAGDAAGAATAYEALLTDRLRILGPDHLDTLTNRNNLASWRGEAGDAAGAAAAFAELLTDRLRVLGPDHPHTLLTRGNLARWRGKAGDAAGAATATAELLTEFLRVLGPDHPHTLTTRGNLAGWRGEAGDAAGAATAYEALLTDRLRVLGPDHLDTLTTRHNLAFWRGEAGDAAGAATAFQALLTEFLRVLGPNHPHTLLTRGNLAAWRGEAGDTAGAATAYEALLTDCLRVLGPDHPHTLTTRGNLATWRGEAGDAAGAAAAFAELLTDRLRVLGPDHPQTPITKQLLEDWQTRASES